MPSPFRSHDLIALAIDAEDGVAPPALVARFARLAEEYAFQNARGDPDERLEAAPDAPGYLVTTSGRWKVFVPWPLAFAFPGPGMLDALVQLCDRTRLNGRGNVALSGSAAFAGRVAAIGDIDLAQYVFEPAENLPTLVEELVGRNSQAILVRAKYGRDFTAPWEEFTASLRRDTSRGLPELRIKFDFLDPTTPFGLMPISNVVLPSDPADHSAGAALQSFVFQEAVLVQDGLPPWPLLMAGEVLRYLKFLVRDTRTYRQKDKYLKALKRALCLVRTLGFSALAVRAEAILGRDSAVAAANQGCLRDVETLWPYLTPKQQITLTPMLNEKKGIAQDLVLPLAGEAGTIIDEILGLVGDLLAQEGRVAETWAA